jgi:hypothetical protein
VRNVETPALSPLGERVARDGAFSSRRGTGEGVRTSKVPRTTGPDRAGLTKVQVRRNLLSPLFFNNIPGL